MNALCMYFTSSTFRILIATNNFFLNLAEE